MALSSDAEIAKAVGQMVIIGFSGNSTFDPGAKAAIDQIKTGKLSGVVLFRYNIGDRQQLVDLNTSFSQAANISPVLIALDQEGGKVQRLRANNGFRDYLSAQEVASKLSPAEAQEYYYALGQELRELRFNWNFAPCVDLHSVGQLPPCQVIGAIERSYGDDPTTVAKYGASMVRGLRRAGVLSCLKHFPGHGSSQGDTHQDIFDVTSTWDPSELQVYQDLIEDNDADAVMTAHLVNRQQGCSKPATLSRHWLSRLRRELKFEGLIVTDDLHMGAIQKHFTLKDCVVDAINASVDLLLFSNNPAAAQGVENFKPDPLLPERVAEIVQEAVEAGELEREQILTAAARVKKFKKLLEER